MKDISDILLLINGFAAKGIMLSRSEFELAENIRDFSIIESETRLIGCAALHFYTPTSAEVRSLAVSQHHQGGGAGALLVRELEREAQTFNLLNIFALTYIPQFFAKLGFREVDRNELPLKVWKECLGCPKLQRCDEVAVLRELRVSNNGVITTPT